MKLNWGTKIASVYIAFVAFIIVMVYLSFGEKYDLVTEDYYAQELAFQDKIDAKNRLESLDENLHTSIENEYLKVDFPHAETTELNGNIHCFRPSDESKDFVVKLENEKKAKHIPLNQFSSGKYLLKISWEADNHSFYAEKTVVIP